MERSEVIKILEDYYEYVTSGGNINEFTEALDYTVRYLKTDEECSYYRVTYEDGNYLDVIGNNIGDVLFAASTSQPCQEITKIELINVLKENENATNSH